jgi:hypothetical protein
MITKAKAAVFGLVALLLVVLAGNFTSQGQNIVQAASVPASQMQVPVYRFWSNPYESHFYTSAEQEFASVVGAFHPNIWKYESIAFGVAGTISNSAPYCADGLSPVYRFWSDAYLAHFYTIFGDEMQRIRSTYSPTVWKYEGVAYCAATEANSELSPVYRFWSEYNKSHFYTASATEKDEVMAKYDDSVWKYEGIAYYVNGSIQAARSTQVASGCPASTARCIPCVPGSSSACRVEDGKSAGFLGWACQNNNPGNIRYSDFRNNLIEVQGVEGACGSRGNSQMGQYMVFRSYTIGRQALAAYLTSISQGRHSSYTDVNAGIACGNCNLRFFFSKYAPAGDQNDPNSYTNFVAGRLGVSADEATLSWVVANKLDQLLDAIQTKEGWYAE